MDLNLLLQNFLLLSLSGKFLRKGVFDMVGVGCAKVLPVFHHIEPSRRRYVHHFNVAGH
jgi:hypothetical protein